MSKTSDHITLPQVARMLRISYQRVYTLFLSGEFSGEKVEGQWHIDPQSLRSFLVRRGILSRMEER